MRKVVVALEGGLGNQMFQYAAGRAMALRTGASLALDVRPLLRRGQRPYGLGAFRLGKDVKLITEGTLPARVGKLRRLVRRLTGGERTFREADFTYDGRFRELRAPARIEGYFQSERYFKESGAAIRAEFAPNADHWHRLDVLTERLLPTGPTLSLHVRRGDYTHPATMAVHGLMSPDYYARALQHVAERVGPTVACVFTDDPAWTRAHLALPPGSLIISDHTTSALDDLVLMSRCSHHIIANSSFSWWGAWLNPRADKVVVTPERWFQPASGLDTRDLRPEGWLRT
jgi:hypothetical protein